MRISTYIFFIVILVHVQSGCGDSKTSDTSTSENLESKDGLIHISKSQFETNEMALGKLQERPFPMSIKTSGMIDVPPENRAVVSAALGGYVKQTPLLIGDVVKRGQLLVTIENPEFVTLQQGYMEVKQRLAYLEAEYERQKTLRAENITSQKNFLKAESEFKTAKAQHNGLKKQLTMLNISPAEVEKGNIVSTMSIFSPLKGSITQMNVTKGSYVSPASPILEIIDNDHIHLELSVFEKDIMKVKKGQQIRFRIPEASEEIFNAEVYLVGTSIGENRTIKVHGHLLEEGIHNFLTGMFVEAEIVTQDTISKALPSDAIIEQEGRFYVLLNKIISESESIFEPIEVQLGSSVNGFTEIKNAHEFSESDTFLTKGAFGAFGE